MSDLRVPERLRRAAAELPPARFELAEVVERGRRRRFRSRVVGSAGLAVTVVLIVAATAFVAGGSGSPMATGEEQLVRVVRPELGPGPLFDPTILGREVGLLPVAEPPAADLETIRTDVDLIAGEPILVVGQVEGTSVRVYRAFGHIEPGLNRAGDLWERTADTWCDWVFDETGTAGPSCMPGILGGWPLSISGTVEVWVNLPDTASVVVASHGDAFSWQRPRGGVAAFQKTGDPSAMYALDPYGVIVAVPGGEDEDRWDPMPDLAAPANEEDLVTAGLRELADLQPGDFLYELRVGDRSAFVRVRAIDGQVTGSTFAPDPPLLLGTACNVVQETPLPFRWKGAWLERTVDGQRVTGPFTYGQELPGGGWTDNGWGEDAAPRQ